MHLNTKAEALRLRSRTRRAGGRLAALRGRTRNWPKGAEVEAENTARRENRGVTEAERHAGARLAALGGAEPGGQWAAQVGGVLPYSGRTSCATARRSRRISALLQVRHPVGELKACRALGRGPARPHQPANATAGPTMGLLRPSGSSSGIYRRFKRFGRSIRQPVQPAVQKRTGGLQTNGPTGENQRSQERQGGLQTNGPTGDLSVRANRWPANQRGTYRIKEPKEAGDS